MQEKFSEEVVLILVGSTIIILILILLITVSLLINQRRKFNHRQQMEKMKNQFDQEMLRSRLEIQTQTHEIISRELHDNIGSNISTAMLLLYKDEQTGREEEQANHKEAVNMLGTIVDDLKNISRSLNPSFLDEIGLNDAIKHRAEQLERTKKYKLELFLHDAPGKLNRQKQVSLFYIFQEAVNNINKHAQAKEIRVNLVYENEKLVMRIRDNGIGMPNKETSDANQKGSGLINMKSHASIINAILEIHSDNNNGTEIIVTVPDPYL